MQKADSEFSEIAKYLKAIMLLQLNQSLTEPLKLEFLFSKAGFTHKEIAEFLGKKQEAVSKTISRAKQEEANDERSEQ